MGLLPPRAAGFPHRPRRRFFHQRERRAALWPLAGAAVCRDVGEAWGPNPFWLIEQGAEDAQLACDILDWCRTQMPACFAAIRYALVEPAGSLREKQHAKIEAGGFLERRRGFAPLPISMIRSAFSFPTNWSTRCRCAALSSARARGGNGAWGLDDEGRFIWVTQPIGDDELAGAIKSLPRPTRDGYATEVHLEAQRWMEEVGRSLRHGYVLTLDYGFPADLYYADFRSSGTLTAYREHRRMEDILAEPGLRDITAHVEFTGLGRAGEQAGAGDSRPARSAAFPDGHRPRGIERRCRSPGGHRGESPRVADADPSQLPRRALPRPAPGEGCTGRLGGAAFRPSLSRFSVRRGISCHASSLARHAGRRFSRCGQDLAAASRRQRAPGAVISRC